MRLVKKLPGPTTTASKVGIASAAAGCSWASGSSQSRVIAGPRLCAASTSTSPREVVPSAYSAHSVDCWVLTGQTRPAQPSSARKPSTAARKSPLYCSIIDSSRLPPVCPRSRSCCEHRHAREQHAARLPLVAGQRERAPQHVARRQHAQLVAKLPRTPSAVEHRHHGVDAGARDCVFRPPSRLGRPVPPPKQPTFKRAQAHGVNHSGGGRQAT